MRKEHPFRNEVFLLLQTVVDFPHFSRLQVFLMKLDERINELTQHKELRVEVLNALLLLLVAVKLHEYVV